MRKRLAHVAGDLAAVPVTILQFGVQVLGPVVVRTFARVRGRLEGQCQVPPAAGRKVVRQSKQPARGALNDIVFQGGVVVDEAGMWVKIVGTRGPETPGTPHGVKHTLTVHGPDHGSSIDGKPGRPR